MTSNVPVMNGFSPLPSRFIVPISCVICNDIMAYMFGFFFGRTPLIKVCQLCKTLSSGSVSLWSL